MFGRSPLSKQGMLNEQKSLYGKKAQTWAKVVLKMINTIS